MIRLDGKRAVVTGAAQGICAAVTHVLAAAVAEVWAVDRNPQPAGWESERVHSRVVDVTRSKQLAELAAATGSVDVLVNCAGIVPVGDLLSCTEEEWQVAAVRCCWGPTRQRSSPEAST